MQSVGVLYTFGEVLVLRREFFSPSKVRRLAQNFGNAKLLTNDQSTSNLFFITSP